jgi:hypothetical protein
MGDSELYFKMTSYFALILGCDFLALSLMEFFGFPCVRRSSEDVDQVKYRLHTTIHVMSSVVSSVESFSSLQSIMYPQGKD